MSNGDRKTVLSSGLSWTAIGILAAFVVAVGAPVVGFGISISHDLGKISATLEQVADDLTDNKTDHTKFREAIVNLNSVTNDHERRLTVLEDK